MSNVITWTKTDESPELASASLRPIIEAFAKSANISIETIDISFSGRILQAFPEYLTAEQRIPSGLEELSQLVRSKDCRLLKLPNASATDNQLKEAIAELQDKGFALPNYPSKPQTQEEKELKARYDAITGSVVNPVMRQGNAVRSIPEAVKDDARRNPHAMGTWRKNSKTRVSHMEKGDFYDTEQSVELSANNARALTIHFVDGSGTSNLMGQVDANAGDIIDSAIMKRSALQTFLNDAINDAKANDLLLSMHLKATMLKKSDGLFFADAVKAYFAPVFQKHQNTLDALEFDPSAGLSDLLKKVTNSTLDQAQKDRIFADVEDALTQGAPLAYANAKDGLTHLSSPNLVIVDVSMANLARWGGEVMDKDGGFGDTLAVIPDSTYARMHQAGIEFLKENGTPDIPTMGSVTTIRLQAEGAEEYGSKNTTYEATEAGCFEIRDAHGNVIMTQSVDAGDVFRMCKTTDRAIQNWIDIALSRANATQDEMIIWLDRKRAHDAKMIGKIEQRLNEVQPTNSANISIKAPEEAIIDTLKRCYAGQNTLAVAGNLLGDHITDYFPILEIGSSAKMLSMIELLSGGIVAETGSGGTAPDLLKFVEENNHFMWYSTGSALALVECFKHIAEKEQNTKAGVLADTLERATQRYIEDDRSPSPQGLDTRESNFYLALYWAQELQKQSDDQSLKAHFTALAQQLEASEDVIMAELKEALSKKADMGGHYMFPDEHSARLMRPVASFIKKL